MPSPPQAAPVLGSPVVESDLPRRVRKQVSTPDRIFHGISAGAALTALAIVGATTFFLIWDSRLALKRAGVWNFFTAQVWNPAAGKMGIGGLLIGTVLIGVIALLLAVPLALGLALFVNEYAPPRVRRPLVSTIDLLAALPSIVFGMWGLFALQGPLRGIAQWFSDHLNSIPLFRVQDGADLTRSTFIGGVVVGIMIVPIITSVSREVMAQCPREQCEGALALGGSRWGMIRNVIFPFSRSGVVGGILLGFGRALGETMAVAIIVALVYQANPHVLANGGGNIAELITVRFPEAGRLEVSGLIAAGLGLFIVTLLVNLGARAILRRTRSALL
jgi:phosphate transport system permease protein